MPDSTFQQFAMTNFSEATQKQIAKLRSDAQNGTTDTSAGGLNAKALTTELNNRLTVLGIDTKPKDDDGKQQLGTIQKYIADGVFQQQQQLGRKMTAQEISQFVDGQFSKNVDVPGVLWGSTSKPMLTESVNNIPSADLDQVKAALKVRGNPNPSNDQILRTYWSRKNNG